MRSFLGKLMWALRRRQREADLQEELRYHLEEDAAEHREAGLTNEQARRAAHRELGNAALVQEDTRSAWTWSIVEQLFQDIRYGLRAIAANRTFSAMAILSLALGIGANTAIFSFMDSILLRSLPVDDPESLVMLSWRMPRRHFNGSNRHNVSFTDSNGGYIGGVFSYPAFELLQKGDSVFQSVFGYQGAGKLNMSFRGIASLENTEYVSGGYFQGLGVRPAAGRLIAADDDRAGAAQVAVISHGLSQERFGGPGGALGQSILINNLPFTVIGIAPPEFFGADPAEHPGIYVPLHANLVLQDRNRVSKIYLDPGFDWVVPMARLRPGVTAAQAQSAMGGAFYAWGREAKPKLKPEEVPTLVIREGASGLDGLRRLYSKPLQILLSLVGLILAIACANIANLLLARASARKREIAVRMSLGAGRFRIVRQLLTESVLLSVIGGALGVGFAVWGIRFLTLLLANGREGFTLRAELNWRVLAVSGGISILSGILFGLAPALQATRRDVLPAIKESRTGEAAVRGFRRMTLSRLLMLSQIAITMIILVAAGLFLRTLSNLASIPLGFNQESLLTFRVDARQAGHGNPEIVHFYNDLRAKLGAIPGVRAVSLSDHSLIGTGTSGTGVRVAGAESQGSSILNIGPGFFSTMQIPLLVGREIDDRDRPGSAMVAVVNEVFAKQRFGDGNPLGQHLSLDFGCPNCSIEIVGVSANTLYGNLKGAPPPTVYLPFSQGAWGGSVASMFYELRTAGNPLSYVPAVRELVGQADSRMPLADVKSQRAWIDQTINQEIVFARLCTGFGILAVLIAAVGLYGAMSYKVARRSAEIGIRMALGAPRSRVVWMVLGEVIVLAGAGLAISMPVALAASKLVESFLFGMQPNDPAALIGSAFTLVAAVILAGYIPARKASSIDPVAALRHE